MQRASRLREPIPHLLQHGGKPARHQQNVAIVSTCYRMSNNNSKININKININKISINKINNGKISMMTTTMMPKQLPTSGFRQSSRPRRSSIRAARWDH
mmetsp:Transcript_16866/g.48159  ORF Transcript_16866/g.48159 Transcript_16866/m.48159 type:complete len:100 (+) Transcript_16866:866-1165(+)